MGNSITKNKEQEDDDILDDFEPIDKPSSPSFMSGSTFSSSAFASVARSSNKNRTSSPPNDLMTSGILVEMTDDEKAALKKPVGLGRRRIGGCLELGCSLALGWRLLVFAVAD